MHAQNHRQRNHHRITPGLQQHPVQTLSINVLGAYSETGNTIKTGAKLDSWCNITGANATYSASITGTAYEIAVPQYNP